MPDAKVWDSSSQSIGGNGMGLIYLSETRDRKDFTSKILEVFKESLERAKKVFVKPNIVSSEPYPTTTHPDVLDAVLSGLSGAKMHAVH